MRDAGKSCATYFSDLFNIVIHSHSIDYFFYLMIGGKITIIVWSILNFNFMTSHFFCLHSIIRFFLILFFSQPLNPLVIIYYYLYGTDALLRN